MSAVESAVEFSGGFVAPAFAFSVALVASAAGTAPGIVVVGVAQLHSVDEIDAEPFDAGRFEMKASVVETAAVGAGNAGTDSPYTAGIEGERSSTAAKAAVKAAGTSAGPDGVDDGPNLHWQLAEQPPQ